MEEITPENVFAEESKTRKLSRGRKLYQAIKKTPRQIANCVFRVPKS